MMLTKQNTLSMLKDVPPQAWCAVTVAGTPIERRWLAVLERAPNEGNSRYRFGLLDDGTWSALYADGARVFPVDVRVPFLPLLESSWRETAAAISSAVRALGLPSKLAWTFPLDETVVLGLNSSDYWHTKAEAWISSGYPLTDEIAALLPRHRRSNVRHRERMASIFGTPDAALRAEFEAADGSFLLKLRITLHWDKDAFNCLVEEMHRYVRERDPEAPIPRWVAEGFWYLDWWVKEWSSHESFPRSHGAQYYEAAYARLHALAFWLFNGSPMYEGKKAYAPL